MTLRCTSTYRNGPLRYNPSDLVYGTPEFEAFLLRDSPGSFVVWQPAPGNPEPDPAPTATAPNRQERRGRRRT